MSGSLIIAGLGPGSETMITPDVQQAIDEATDIVGYIHYVRRIVPRLTGPITRWTWRNRGGVLWS